MALTTISPHDAQELIARGAKLIDIRDADEYLREHIPEADLAPLSVLEQSGLPPKLRREQIIFHCQAGKRTSNNADKLAAIAAPAEIFLLEDGFGWAFIINILLTLLGYIPGLIHAFWVQTRD
jgi:uncharacterized membrane protein YqaE (UPF0057 family)